MADDVRALAQRKLNFFQTLKAVFWGFLGVRKGRGYEEDIARLNPLHLIVAGVIATVLFVLGLIAVARWVIGQAGLS